MGILDKPPFSLSGENGGDFESEAEEQGFTEEELEEIFWLYEDYGQFDYYDADDTGSKDSIAVTFYG